MFSMCKTNCSSNDCVICSSLITPGLFTINFDQVYYEIFFSLKYLFHFLYQLLLTLIMITFIDTFMEVQPSNMVFRICS